MFKDTQCEAWKTNGGYPLQQSFNKYIWPCSLHFLLSTKVIIITNMTMYCYLKTVCALCMYVNVI